MGPIAQKVIKELRKSRTREVIDLDAVREAKKFAAELAEPIVEEGELSRVPFNVRVWLQALQMHVGLASVLLSLHALRKHAERIEGADEEYMPGGPPKSPVYDSVFTSWWMADLTIGSRGETLCTILADVGAALGLPSGPLQLALSLGKSHWSIYQAKRLAPERVELTDLTLGTVLTAQLAEDCGTDGLWLARPFPSPMPDMNSDWTVVVTPYLLPEPGATQAWKEYLGRVTRGVKPTEHAAALRRHFKGVGNSKRVLEYIMDGYGGVTKDGPIALVGVPDQPETLPHSREYEQAQATVTDAAPLTPFDTLRKRLWAEAAAGEESIEADRLFREARVMLGAPEHSTFGRRDAASMARRDGPLQLAYSTYGHVGFDGCTVLERFEPKTQALSAEQAQELAALRAGWCSAFEIRHIRLDEGLEVLDTLRRKKLWVREKLATRELQRGDLVFGWIVVHEDAVTLEGALLRVPAPIAPLFVEQLRGIRDSLASKCKGLDWRKRLGLLPPYAVALFDALVSNLPAPTVVNHDGHELLWSTAHYAVLDRRRLLAVLSEKYEAESPNSFARTEGNHLVANLTLTDDRLVIECNSRERLAQEKATLERMAHGLLRHRADEHVDPLSESSRAAAAGAAPEPPPPLTPELQQAMSEVALNHMHQWVDEAVPSLDGKTPRQAARSARGRETVQVLLNQQAKLFRKNPQTAHVDLQPIYETLGLAPPPTR